MHSTQCEAMTKNPRKRGICICFLAGCEHHPRNRCTARSQGPAPLQVQWGPFRYALQKLGLGTKYRLSKQAPPVSPNKAAPGNFNSRGIYLGVASLFRTRVLCVGECGSAEAPRTTTNGGREAAFRFPLGGEQPKLRDLII